MRYPSFHVIQIFRLTKSFRTSFSSLSSSLRSSTTSLSDPLCFPDEVIEAKVEGEKMGYYKIIDKKVRCNICLPKVWSFLLDCLDPCRK